MKKINNNKMDVENISFRYGLVDSPEASIILKSTNMQQEIWKDVPNYEGYYQVSNLGHVKSLSRDYLRNGKYLEKTKEKILKNLKDTHGYLYVSLHKNKKAKNFRIHVLVAMSFLGHIPNGGYTLVVDHIDNNRINNILENLQLITQRQNSSKDKKNTSSKYTGVTWHNRDKKWQSSIKIDGKSKYIGYFDTEIEAHIAYQKELNKIENN